MSLVDDEPADVTRPRSLDRFAVGVVTVALAALGIVGLGQRSVWIDEVYSFEVATAPTADLWSTWSLNGGNMTLYLAFMRAWTTLGETEFWLRLPSVAFACAAVPVVWMVARRILDRRSALMATAVFAFSAAGLQYAREARGYSLLVLLLVCSWHAAIDVFEHDRRKAWFVVAATLSVYAHVVAVVFVAAQLLWLLVGIKSLRRVAPMGLGVLLLVSPQLFVATRPEASSPDWIDALESAQVGQLLVFLSGSNTQFVAGVVLALWVAGGFASRSLSPSRPHLAFVPIFWLVVPVASLVLVSVAKPMIVDRYLLATIPAGAILVGAALGRLGNTGWLALAVLMAAVAPTVADVHGEREPDWRTPMDMVFAESTPDDGILFFGGSEHLADYYWWIDGQPAVPSRLGHDGPWSRPTRRGPAPDLELARRGAREVDAIWVLIRWGPSLDVDATADFIESVVDGRPVEVRWNVGRVTLQRFGG